MPLRLSIENVSTLPDGGPLEYTITGKRGIDIGRDQYLDWVLPDPSRVISGKHCEIRYRDGAYWLSDISRNGTFVNHSTRRLQEPHRLANGDRVEIGHYIIRVEFEGEPAHGEESAVPRPRDESLWKAPPDLDSTMDLNARLRRLQPNRVPAPDPFEQLFDLPPVTPPPPPVTPAPKPALSVTDIFSAPFTDGSQAPFQQPTRDLGPRFSPGPEPGPVEPPPRRVEQVVRAQPQPERPAGAAPEPVPPSAAEFLARFAKGAGIDPSAIAVRDAGEFAEALGKVLHVCASNVTQLLTARVQAKRAMRSMNQTFMQSEDNNPLRFQPTVEDALVVMLRSSTRYLGAHEAFDHSFQQLKTHQIDTFAAIQESLLTLIGDLDPAAIERSLGGEAPKGRLFNSDKAYKARLWDEFASRWKMKAGADGNGMLGAFMRLFGEAYDRKTQ